RAPATGWPVLPRLKVVTLWPRATPSSATARERNTVPPSTRISIGLADQKAARAGNGCSPPAQVEYLPWITTPHDSCHDDRTALRELTETSMPIATPEIYN